MKIIFSILIPLVLLVSQLQEETTPLAAASGFTAQFIGSDVQLCEVQCADYVIEITGGNAPFRVPFFANNVSFSILEYWPNDVFRICRDDSEMASRLFPNETPIRLAIPEDDMPYTIRLDEVIEVNDPSCLGTLIPGGPFTISASNNILYTADIPRFICDSITLPAIMPNSTTVQYYTGPGGTGDIYSPGDVLDFNNINLANNDLLDTLYLYDPISPGCGEQVVPFEIIRSPVHFSRQDTALCDQDYTLPPFPLGPFTTAAATYASDIDFTPSSILPEGSIINTSQTIYIADTSYGLFGGSCVFLDSFDVRITRELDAGEDSTHIVCVGSTTIIPSFAELLGNPDAGGIWTSTTMLPDVDYSNPLNVDLSGMNVGDTFVFFYTLENPPCALEVATLTFRAVASPYSGDSGSFDFCQADSPIDLIALLNEPAEQGNWFQQSGAQIDLSNPRQVDLTLLPEDIYVLDYEAPSIPGNNCPTPRATLTINLSSGPNAGDDNIAVVCRGDTLDLSTLISTDADMGGIYSVEGFPQPDSLWDSGIQITDPMADFLEVTASYIVASTSLNCGADTAEIKIILLQTPNAGIPITNPALLCKGVAIDLSTLLQNATPNGQFYLQPGFANPIDTEWSPTVDNGMIAYITPGTQNCPPDTSYIMIEAADPIMASFMLDEINICDGDCVTGTFTLDREAEIDLNISDPINGDSYDYKREKFDNNSFTICPGSIFGDAQSDTIFIGQATTIDFTIIDIIDTDYGCDNASLLTTPTTLMINESYESTRTGEVCAGYTTSIDGIEYGASTELNLRSINGCDSIIYIVIDTIAQDTGLIVLNCLSGTETILGQDFTQDINEVVAFPGISFTGCDSLARVQLSFSNLAIGTVDTFACTGNNIMIDGQILDAINNTTDVPYLPGSVQGCDSLIRYTLRFYPAAEGMLDTTICLGDTFVKGFTTFGLGMTSGTALLQNQSNNDCDSLLMVNVTFRDEIRKDSTINLCDGQTIIINGTTYGGQRLVGTEILLGINGACDTLLNITIDPLIADNQTFNDDLCSGDDFELNGTTYTANNAIGRDTLLSSAGCDSIIYIINLNVLNLDINTAVSAACDMDTEGLITVDITAAGLGYPVEVYLEGTLVETLPNSTSDIVNIAAMPGSYLLELIGTNCNWSDNLTVATADQAMTTIIAQDLGSNTYQLGISSTLLPTQISWTPTDILDCSDCLDPIATLTQETEVVLEITSAAGCTQMATLLLPYEEIIPDSTIIIYQPNTLDFSIPGDDIFYVQSNYDTNITTLNIYDRWGGLVYSNENFMSNAPEQGWNGTGDGTGNGLRVEPGLYVYRISYRVEQREEVVSGQLLVLN